MLVGGPAVSPHGSTWVRVLGHTANSRTSTVLTAHFQEFKGIFLPTCHLPVCLLSVAACIWGKRCPGGGVLFCRETVRQLKESLLVLGDAECYLQLCRPCTLKWAWANNSAGWGGGGGEGISKRGACNNCLWLHWQQRKSDEMMFSGIFFLPKPFVFFFFFNLKVLSGGRGGGGASFRKSWRNHMATMCWSPFDWRIVQEKLRKVNQQAGVPAPSVRWTLPPRLSSLIDLKAL